MKDIAARELKGHNILAVERFWDSTFWMIEFTVLRPTAYGEPGDEMRLFLTEDGYQSALQSQQRREIKIKRWQSIILRYRCGNSAGIYQSTQSRPRPYQGWNEMFHRGPDWEKGRWKPRGTNGRNALYPRR